MRLRLRLRRRRRRSRRSRRRWLTSCWAFGKHLLLKLQHLLLRPLPPLTAPLQQLPFSKFSTSNSLRLSWLSWLSWLSYALLCCLVSVAWHLHICSNRMQEHCRHVAVAAATCMQIQFDCLVRAPRLRYCSQNNKTLSHDWDTDQSQSLALVFALALPCTASAVTWTAIWHELKPRCGLPLWLSCGISNKCRSSSADRHLPPRPLRSTPLRVPFSQRRLMLFACGTFYESLGCHKCAKFIRFMHNIWYICGPALNIINFEGRSIKIAIPMSYLICEQYRIA